MKASIKISTSGIVCDQPLEFDAMNETEIIMEIIKYQTDQERILGSLSEYYGHNDLDVVSAGVALGISISNIDLFYAGQYSSDEDFAIKMAEQQGVVICYLQWPYSCIDWKQAAKVLMHDYVALNGHYFRVEDEYDDAYNNCVMNATVPS